MYPLFSFTSIHRDNECAWYICWISIRLSKLPTHIALSLQRNLTAFAQRWRQWWKIIIWMEIRPQTNRTHIISTKLPHVNALNLANWTQFVHTVHTLSFRDVLVKNVVRGKATIYVISLIYSTVASPHIPSQSWLNKLALALALDRTVNAKAKYGCEFVLLLFHR